MLHGFMDYIVDAHAMYKRKKSQAMQIKLVGGGFDALVTRKKQIAVQFKMLTTTLNSLSVRLLEKWSTNHVFKPRLTCGN